MSAGRGRRGVSAIEFALVIGLLLALLGGIMDWSWYMYHWLTVTMAGNRGVRLAAGVAENPGAVAEAAACATMVSYRLDCATARIDTTVTTDASGDVLSLMIELPFVAPVGLVRVPSVLRTRASTSWYGSLYAEAP